MGRERTYTCERTQEREERERVGVLGCWERGQNGVVRRRVENAGRDTCQRYQPDAMWRRRVCLQRGQCTHGHHVEDPADEKLHSVGLGYGDDNAADDERGPEDERERQSVDC